LRGGDYAGALRLCGFDCRTTLLWTLPLRMHRVHTTMRRTLPPIWARTSCKFGSHRRLVLLLAWLTLFPTDGCFPHIAQCLMVLYRIEVKWSRQGSPARVRWEEG
jgi:hypothetical protein